MSKLPTKDPIIVCINGMTCASCELLLEKKLKAVSGIQDVDIDHRSGIARITTTGKPLNYARIANVITNAGYAIADGTTPTLSTIQPDSRKWMEIGGALLVIFAVYMLLDALHLLSFTPSLSGTLSAGGIFLIGLVAGTSSCLAVTGGLMLALAARHNANHLSETQQEKLKPLLHFNVGRLISYFILGGAIGALGQSFTLSARMSGYMSIIVACIMLYLALSILEIIPKGSFPIRPPKKLSRWIMGLSESNHPLAPFSLGALTFFLPCGFTQSLQLAALASGNFATGAMIMFLFALGTLPALIGVSVLSATASGGFSRIFLRFSGTLVLVLALFNIHNGLALAGFTFPLSSSIEADQTIPRIHNGIQEVSMNITPYGYEPRNLTIQAGIPVRWNIDGTDAAGCTSIMTIPSLNISQAIYPGQNVIDFTAEEPGQLAFMCSMGMVRGSFTVL